MTAVNWASQEILVSRAEMTLVQSSPVEIRELDVDQFRKELNALQASEGIAYPTTHEHVTPTNISGVTLGRVVRLINGYTVTFEDGQYAVNLVGANNNIADRTNVNQVSVRSSNSAGLVTIETQTQTDGIWTVEEKDSVVRTTKLVPALL